MKKENGQLVFSPSDLITFTESRFASWMDRYHLEFPGQLHPDEDSESDDLVQRQGIAHEKAWVERLIADRKDVFTVDATRDPAAITLAAMREGRQVVYQGRLVRKPFAGFADFLERTEGDSALGDFHYEICDTKLARSTKPYFLLQLCAYAEMLEEVQGRLPEHIHVVLGTGERKSYPTNDVYFYYLTVKQAFLDEMANFDPSRRPEPEPSGQWRRWTSEAEAFFERTDHLYQVANITRTQIRRIEAAGIRTLTELATSDSGAPKGISNGVWNRLHTQAQLQHASRPLDVPEYRVIAPPAEFPRRGLGQLPPASESDVYFDMEGFPLAVGGLEYLFGAVYVDHTTPTFIDWWAHDASTEKQAFEGFIDWVFERWQRDPTLHIYHYAPYEVTALKRLMGQYGTREDELDTLLRNDVFVDLYKVVRGGVLVGTPSYSIKSLEPLYGRKRAGNVKAAADSIVTYQKWIDSGEPNDWQRSPLLRDIRAYNEEDCRSTLELCQWLRDQQQANHIAWVVPTSRPDVPANPPRSESEALSAKMLAAIPDGALSGPDADVWRLQELLAHLTLFHRREEKPFWWAYFAYQLMSEGELYDEAACLAGLRRDTREPVVAVKRSKGFWYTFDPEQETKLAVGDRCVLSHDVNVGVEVLYLQLDEGRICLKISIEALEKAGGDLPGRLSLLPFSLVPTATLTKAIMDVAQVWHTQRFLPPAIDDFLRRRPPTIPGFSSANLVQEGEEPLDAAIRLASAMDGGCLSIQGPPGCGKTYASAKVILALVRQGKRVGIAANSHKAVLNLMRECVAQAGGSLSGIKVGGDPNDPLMAQCHGIRVQDPNKSANSLSSYKLFGGVAWFFCRDDVVDQFDTLVVDEAGQVSVANLIAMARCAKNLLLVGDQAQLGQPTQGTHPGESGLSALDYLLQDHVTVPPDRGVFLGTTWRLHPEICEFISSAFYDGRLQSHPDTRNRVVRVPPKGASLVQIESGVVFIPVVHEGNTQSSPEEARQVRAVAEELLGRTKTDKNGANIGEITWNDLLFVTPYNAQVRRLREALGPDAKVASVDKFQGQEAAIVIVSMCSSDAENSPRGIEFVLDRHRVNVAISRAQSLAVVVGSPALAQTLCRSVDQVMLVNTFCRIAAYATSTST